MCIRDRHRTVPVDEISTVLRVFLPLSKSRNFYADGMAFCGLADVYKRQVLGHVQRGGSPSPRDRVLASMMGEKAVDLLMDGVGGHCVGMIDNKVTSMPIEEALSSPRHSRKDLYRLFDRLV